jgi:hypothetical protein
VTAKNQNPLSDYFTREELAEALGRTTKTLDRWDLNGLGPPRVQIGKLILYSKKTVEKWLREREGKHHATRIAS